VPFGETKLEGVSKNINGIFPVFIPGKTPCLIPGKHPENTLLVFSIEDIALGAIRDLTDHVTAG